MADSVYATRCDAHVNRLDICGTFAETPQHHHFFGVNGEKSLCLCASVAIIFVAALALRHPAHLLDSDLRTPLRYI